MEKLALFKEPDLLDQVHCYFNDAGEKTGIPKEYLEYIKKSNTVLTFKLPLQKDNGEFEILEAYRVQHSCHKMPCKGGVRLSATLNERTAEAMAILTTIKMGLSDIPFGGSFGGVRCDPKKYTLNELEKIIRRYTMELAQRGLIGPAMDVPEPDLHVNTPMMSWMKDTYQILYGNKDINAAAVCTGKPPSQGGIAGREGAWGLGVCQGIEGFLSVPSFSEKYKIKPGLSGKTVILAGFGKIGYWTGKFLIDSGCKIIGITARNSAVYNESGIDFEEAAKHYKGAKNFKHFKNGVCEDGYEKVLYKPCDILIAASVECIINIINVDKINTKIFVEAINGSISYYAQKVLEAKGVAVIPDIVINIGWSVCSYFEWLKNIEHVKLGRLLKGWEKKTKEAILNLMGKKVEKPSDVEGGTEEDIVNAALVDILKTTVNEVCSLAEGTPGQIMFC